MTERVGGGCVDVPLEATKSSLGTMLVSQTSFACKGGSPLHVGPSYDFLFSRGDALFGPAGLELLEHADGGILSHCITVLGRRFGKGKQKNVATHGDGTLALHNHLYNYVSLPDLETETTRTRSTTRESNSFANFAFL